ncbi:cytochrome C oxidase subunit IV family protein [Paenibacillus thermotolerans]|uniref:cytochrome C oxidase subunit IV family protein n=1 Tax=Paenibacillus thermotolerans TaxID=3027807 RepID=UPI002367BCFD|nr:MULTISPECIES: cytochrome C oxidase subunit IV family protein [unclassified Paenibacillus]
MSNMEHSNAEQPRKHRHEGPRNHLLAFALSILLTAFAFIAVMNTEIEPWWVIVFILTLAIFQAVIQLAYWMHMKDRGHFLPIIGIAFGFIVALTAVASGLLMSWL